MSRSYIVQIIITLIMLTYVATGCDSGNEPVCGNNVIEGAEQCDGTDLGGATCKSLGHDDGELSCGSYCTFDESQCSDCGNEMLEQGEQCDGEDLGDSSCESLGHDGGQLACGAGCKYDESGCYDCEGDDPCEGISCSGHGTCKVSDCMAYCVCDPGYAPAPGNECISDSMCVQMGKSCEADHHCCSGYCYKPGGGEPGYCSFKGCNNDDFCKNSVLGGREMCCMEMPDGFACIKVEQGQTCGERKGACGDNCTGELSSACQTGLQCVSNFPDDPDAICMAPCETDADCSGCSLENDPDAEFICYEYPIGSFCNRRPVDCESSTDCDAEYVCTWALDDDLELLRKGCTRHGALEIGEKCDQSNPDNSYYDACQGFCARYGHSRCSEFCVSDEDCPETMGCYMIPFCKSLDCQEAVPRPVCVWNEGSNIGCESNSDCEAGEYCQYYFSQQGDFKKQCVTENCEPTGDDCLLPGEECGPGFPPCWGGLCLTNNTGFSHCRALCETSADCGDGLACGTWPHEFGEDIGICTHIEGSGAVCGSDADCEEGEACQYYLLHAGIESICLTANEGGGGVGDACQSSSECASNLCFGFGCTAVCEVDADCPDGYLCGGFTFKDFEFEYVSFACFPFDGSEQQCSRDADCPTGEACNFIIRHDEIDALCTTASNTGGQVGDACGAGHDPCYNNMCITDDVESWCGAICQEDADCPEGYLCENIYMPGGISTLDIGICWTHVGSQTPCSNNAECPIEDEICGYVFPVDGSIEGRCRTEVSGGVEPGEPCEVATDCLNRLCPAELGVCTAYCETNADCETYGMECFNAWWCYWWGSYWNGRGCAPPGPDAPYCSLCASDADCVGEQAKCIESTANPGEKYCGKPCSEADDCPDGSSCVDVGDGVMNCRPDEDTCIPG